MGFISGTVTYLFQSLEDWKIQHTGLLLWFSFLLPHFSPDSMNTHVTWTLQLPHSLPSNYLRLDNVILSYMETGYIWCFATSILPKVTDIRFWNTAAYFYCFHSCYVTFQVQIIWLKYSTNPVTYFCDTSYQRFRFFFVGTKTFKITLFYNLHNCPLLTVDVSQVFTLHFIFMELRLIYIPINSHPIHSMVIIWGTVMAQWNVNIPSDKIITLHFN